jgi:hypothetical protein
MREPYPDASTIDAQTTPFDAVKTAAQGAQFAIDPSQGLTRTRYGWYSNGALFDDALVSAAPGEITLATTATGSDAARIRSAFAGQYVSQAVAQPGLRVAVADANVTFTDGQAALSHGAIYCGAFWWDEAAAQVDTGIGLRLDTSGLAAIWKSDGTHYGASPVAQSDWSTDRLDGGRDRNPSGIRLDPSDGWIYNFPFTWYNAGRLAVSVVDPATDELHIAHEFVPREAEPGAPSLSTANLPVQVVVRNDGTADPLEARLGGMQYSLYGGQGALEQRDTYAAADAVAVTTDTPSPPDPIATPGDPLYAVRREPGAADVELSLREFAATPDGGDVTITLWDEFDPATALTDEAFEPTFRANSTETKTEFDRSATAYSPATAAFRGLRPVDSGAVNEDVVTQLDIEERIPIGAARVVAATDDDSTGPTVDYVATTVEGY